MNNATPVHDQLEAEIKCTRCKAIKWVAFELRHSGHYILPPGVTANTTAHCRACPINQDHMVWSGTTRWKATP